MYLFMFNTFEEILSNPHLILLRMKEYNHKLKTKKCSFFQRKANFLGHMVSEKDCDPSKNYS